MTIHHNSGIRWAWCWASLEKVPRNFVSSAPPMQLLRVGRDSKILIATFAHSRFASGYSKQRTSQFSNRNKFAVSAISSASPLGYSPEHAEVEHAPWRHLELALLRSTFWLGRRTSPRDFLHLTFRLRSGPGRGCGKLRGYRGTHTAVFRNQYGAVKEKHMSGALVLLRNELGITAQFLKPRCSSASAKSLEGCL